MLNIFDAKLLWDNHSEKNDARYQRVIGLIAGVGGCLVKFNGICSQCARENDFIVEANYHYISMYYQFAVCYIERLRDRDYDSVD